MILEIYAYRDRQLGAYTVPIVNNIPVKRAQVSFSRGIVGLSKEQKSKMLNFDLYHLGSYDDESGLINAIQPEFIFSLDSIISTSEEEAEKEATKDE